MTLTEFLLARIAEDEAKARESDDFHPEYAAVYLVPLHPDRPQHESLVVEPGRLVRECEAKRAIVAEHEAQDNSWSRRTSPVWQCRRCAEGDMYDGLYRVDYPCDTIKSLAAVYADHPDYLPEWKP